MIDQQIFSSWDACLLLMLHPVYREFPVEWVERHLARVDGFELEKTFTTARSFSISRLEKQLGSIQSCAANLTNIRLGTALATVVDGLRAELREFNQPIQLGEYYVVTATRVGNGTNLLKRSEEGDYLRIGWLVQRIRRLIGRLNTTVGKLICCIIFFLVCVVGAVTLEGSKGKTQGKTVLKDKSA